METKPGPELKPTTPPKLTLAENAEGKTDNTSAPTEVGAGIRDDQAGGGVARIPIR